MQGDDYQARWFWRNVCRLFDPSTKVIKVCYEADNVKSFDDVVVHYGPGMKDEKGHDLGRDFYQVKFHVTSAGAFSGATMMNPSFINATAFSILQRLRDAQAAHAPNGTEARFIIYSPWVVDPNDVLAEIHSQQNGELLLDKLFTATSKSKIGKLREQWKVHAGLQSDTELRTMLMPLRIRFGFQLQASLEDLSTALGAAGFMPLDAGRLNNPYDDLVRKLLARQRRCEFTRSEIQKVCEQEGLWRGLALNPVKAHRLAIRTFSRGAEHLEDENDAVLCLLHHFDDRKIKDSSLWDNDVFRALDSFLKQELKGKHTCHVHLNAHASIAFAMGYLTDSKIGVEVVPVQSTSKGKEVWHPSAYSNQASGLPSVTCVEDVLASSGQDVAICLGITKDIVADVKCFCTSSLPCVARIVSFTVGAVGSQAIQSGVHARSVAEHVAHYLKTQRSPAERSGTLHVFAAAPNGLVFFLGQLARGFGQTRLYEYDFEQNTPGAYTLSMSLPNKPTKT